MSKHYILEISDFIGSGRDNVDSNGNIYYSLGNPFTEENYLTNVDYYVVVDGEIYGIFTLKEEYRYYILKSNSGADTLFAIGDLVFKGYDWGAYGEPEEFIWYDANPPSKIEIYYTISFFKNEILNHTWTNIVDYTKENINFGKKEIAIRASNATVAHNLDLYIYSEAGKLPEQYLSDDELRMLISTNPNSIGFPSYLHAEWGVSFPYSGTHSAVIPEDIHAFFTYNELDPPVFVKPVSIFDESEINNWWATVGLVERDPISLESWYLDSDGSPLTYTNGWVYVTDNPTYATDVYYDDNGIMLKAFTVPISVDDLIKNFSNYTGKTLYVLNGEAVFTRNCTTDIKTSSFKEIHDCWVETLGLTRNKTENLTVGDYLAGLSICAKYKAIEEIDIDNKCSLKNIDELFRNGFAVKTLELVDGRPHIELLYGYFSGDYNVTLKIYDQDGLVNKTIEMDSASGIDFSSYLTSTDVYSLDISGDVYLSNDRGIWNGTLSSEKLTGGVSS